MKNLLRFMLMFAALIVGGITGYYLLRDIDTVRIIMFLLLCSFFGEIFYLIDKRISK